VEPDLEKNYALARRYFSYRVLERRLGMLLADCLGESSGAAAEEEGAR